MKSLGMLVLLVCVAAVMGCEVRPGPVGPTGPRGLDGAPGMPGEPGPAGPQVLPIYTFHRVDAANAGGVAAAVCPSNMTLISGGADCVLCSPAASNAYLFGSGPSNDGASFIGGCFPGCAHAVALCVSSSIPGTVVFNAVDPSPGVIDVEVLQAHRDAMGTP